MGLDAVELVMAVEQEFTIEISDAEAAAIQYVRDLHVLVLSALRKRGDMVDSEAVWVRLRPLIVEQLGVRIERVTPDAHFVRDLGID